MSKARESRECKCDHLETMADDPTTPVEFDSALNEFHLLRKNDGYWMIYFCPFCGGHAPNSRRDRLFHKLTEAERKRLIGLTEHLKTLDEVTATFGPPDIDQPSGLVKVTPESDGGSETTERFRVCIYTKLSQTADVRVTVYPDDRVGTAFWAKGVKKTAKE